MNLKPLRRMEGQTLVIVALALFALIGLVAVAVDGGNLMAERRRMQNAADAGALAGAREICFGSPSNAVATARDYAMVRNGADQAEVAIQDIYTVHVTTTKTVDTFFAGLIGFPTADVGAEAAAMCSAATRAGGIWPLAIQDQPYRDLPCDQPFYAFVATNDNENKDIAKIDCDECVCDVPLPGGQTAFHLGPGERGWLNLFQPTTPYPDLCGKQDCGYNDVGCWLQYGHPGPIGIGDCLPGKSGVSAAAKNPVNNDAKGNIYNLVLYDRGCGVGDPPQLGTCPGDLYHVSGFGCVQIGYEPFGASDDPWLLVDFPAKYPTKPNDYCAKNVKVIIVTKRCGDICNSTSGSGGGEIPDPDDVRAVSLLK